MKALPLAAVAGLLTLFAGCGGGGGSGTALERGPTVAGFGITGGGLGDGEPVDVRFTCDGDNVSPALEWTGVPDGTEEFALAVDDPDAPGRTFTHWLVYGLDPSETSLQEGVSGAPAVLEGENDFGETGYGGPCPPRGEEHRYVFRLLALDAPSGLEPGAERAAFDEAVGLHVIGEARLTATYRRS